MKIQLKTATLLLAGTLLLSSCGNGTNNNDDEDTTAMERVENAIMGTDEQDFVKDAVEMNEKEMAWLSAGANMGTDNELKEAARTMMADHEQLGMTVKDYATKNNLELPTVDASNEVDINEKAGRDWDKKWADKMVDDHEKVINRFERAQGNVEDAELKEIINNALPKLRDHLEMARKLKEKLNG